MNTIPFRTTSDAAAALATVVPHLRGGGLIAYPTETVYGFGCLLQTGALERLARLKGRSESKPFLVLISDAGRLQGVTMNRTAQLLAERFWPGPLTLALRAEPGRFPERVLSTDGAVAVRATSHVGIRTLLTELGEPLTSSSANAPGEPPATSAVEAAAALRKLQRDDVWLLDGGVLPPSQPSTVVDCSMEPARVLRAGAIPVTELQAVGEQIDV